MILLSVVSYAQDFNSVRKPLLLNKVSVRPIIEPDSVQVSKDSQPSKIIDTASFTNFQFQPLHRSPKIIEEKQTIEFSKPLAFLYKTSSYGMRFHPILKKWRFHSGVDLASNADTVYSMLSGKVKKSGYSPTLGFYVRTEHSNGNIEVLYAHLSQYHYLDGESISAGQPLGITGSTGLSTGDHLHLGVYKNGKHLNPIKFMSEILRFNNNISTQNNEHQNKRKGNFVIDGDIRAGYANYHHE